MAKLGDGSTETFMREAISSVVAAVLAIRSTGLAVRERMASDALLVQQARSLGGPADLGLPDGTAPAGALMLVLLEAGGAAVPGQNLHAYRHVFEPRVDHPDITGTGLATKLVEMTLGALGAATHEGRELGRARLARVGEVWARHRDRLSAEREIEAEDRAEGERRRPVVEAAHDERLRIKREAEERFKGIPQRHDGSPVGPCFVCGSEMGRDDAVVDRRSNPVRVRHKECSADHATEAGPAAADRQRPSPPPGRWVAGVFVADELEEAGPRVG